MSGQLISPTANRGLSGCELRRAPAQLGVPARATHGRHGIRSHRPSLVSTWSKPAADCRGAAQPHHIASARQRVRGLEATLGHPLLQRHSQGVHTTDASRTLLHHAPPPGADGTASRRTGGLWRRAARPCPPAVQHVCDDRPPARTPGPISHRQPSNLCRLGGTCERRHH